MSTIINTSKLKGNKVYTMTGHEAMDKFQDLKYGFLIPKAQRGLSPEFEFKEIMLEGTFSDLQSFYIKNNLKYNLQVLTLLKSIKRNDQQELGDGFQRISTFSFANLVCYREAILDNKSDIVDSLEYKLFRGDIRMNPGKTFVIQIENKKHSIYLNRALKVFFSVLSIETEEDSYESISGKIINSGKLFSSKYKEAFDKLKVDSLSENAYASTIYNLFKCFEVGGSFHRFFTKKTASNFGGGDFNASIELFNYLQHIEFTFSIPPEEIDLNLLFERINTPNTVLQQFDIFKNVVSSSAELEEPEVEELIESTLASFEDKIDILTTSEKSKPTLRLLYVEVALHSLLDSEDKGVVMTSTAGQVNNTVISFFKKESLKEGFSLLKFILLMNDLIDTDLALRGKSAKGSSIPVPDSIAPIAFLLNKTSKMRSRFSIPLLNLAKKILVNKKGKISDTENIVNFFSCYRILRSDSIIGTNPEKSSDRFFSRTAILISNEKNISKKLWELSKEKNLFTDIETFETRLKTWSFDYNRKADKEIFALINWTTALFSEASTLREQNFLNYEVETTVPHSFIKNRIRATYSDLSVSIHSSITEDYYTKFYNYGYISKVKNLEILEKRLSERKKYYSEELPFKFQKEILGENTLHKITCKEDIKTINKKREVAFMNLLTSALYINQ